MVEKLSWQDVLPKFVQLYDTDGKMYTHKIEYHKRVINGINQSSGEIVFLGNSKDEMYRNEKLLLEQVTNITKNRWHEPYVAKCNIRIPAVKEKLRQSEFLTELATNLGYEL